MIIRNFSRKNVLKSENLKKIKKKNNKMRLKQKEGNLKIETDFLTWIKNTDDQDDTGKADEKKQP